MKASVDVQRSLSPRPATAAPALHLSRFSRLTRAAASAALAGLLLASGCVREAAKEATRGTIEAIERKTTDAKAPRGGAAPEETAADTRAPDTKGADAKAPDAKAPDAPRSEPPLVGSIVQDAVGAGVQELGRQSEALQPVVAEVSESVSGGVIEGALEHDRQLFALIEQGSGVAARAIAREGSAQLVEQLAACSAGDPGCPQTLAAIERASRAAASGFADGLGRSIRPWVVGLAFGSGVLFAAIAALAIAAVTRRRDRLFLR